MEKPIETTRAIEFLYLSLGIGIVKSLLDFSHLSSKTSAVFTLSVLIFTFAFLIFLIIKISGGRNWARIVFLIFFLLGVPLAIPLYLEEFRKNVFLGSLSSIQVILQVAALILLFMKNSNLWFRTRKQL